MFADDTRTTAYLAAIARAVQPGSVVVEIGTGVGYFAVAACRAGARRVYAIETHPAIELAERIAEENGCADRITFIRDDSRRVTLPELGDVLLSDLRGVLPPYESHFATIADARRRLIRPGATMIPSRDTLWAAPCLAPATWARDHVAHGDAPHGISRRAVTEWIRSDWIRCRLDAPDVLADGCQWRRSITRRSNRRLSRVARRGRPRTTVSPRESSRGLTRILDLAYRCRTLRLHRARCMARRSFHLRARCHSRPETFSRSTCAPIS